MIESFKVRRLLVCDPDQDNRKKFCDILARLGVESDNLICVSTIREVADLAPSIDPDVIFVELHVNQESGYSLCSLLNSMNHDHNIPVVLMAYPEDGIGPLRGIAMRGRGFINKPVQLLPLQRTLLTLFRERDLEKTLADDTSYLNCCTATQLLEVATK